MICILSIILMSISALHADTNTNAYYSSVNGNSKPSHREQSLKNNIGQTQWNAAVAIQAGLPSGQSWGYAKSQISYFGLTASQILANYGIPASSRSNVLLFGSSSTTTDVIVDQTVPNNFTFLQIPTIISAGNITVDLIAGSTNPPFVVSGVSPLFNSTATTSSGITIFGDVIIHGSLTLAQGTTLNVTGNLYIFGTSSDYLKLNHSSTLNVGGDLLLNGGNPIGGTKNSWITIGGLGVSVNVDGNILIANHYSATRSAVLVYQGTLSAGLDIIFTQNESVISPASSYVAAVFCNAGVIRSINGNISFIANSGSGAAAVSVEGASISAPSGDVSFISNSGAYSNTGCVYIEGVVSADNINFDANSAGNVPGNGVEIGGTDGNLQATGNINFNANIGGADGNIHSGYGVKLVSGHTTVATGNISFNGNQGGSKTTNIGAGHSGVFIDNGTFTAASITFNGNIGGAPLSGGPGGNGAELVPSIGSIPCYSFNNTGGSTTAAPGFIYQTAALTTQGATINASYTGPVPQVTSPVYVQFGTDSSAVGVEINNTSGSGNNFSFTLGSPTINASAGITIDLFPSTTNPAFSVTTGTTPTFTNNATLADGVVIHGDVIIYGHLTLMGSAKLTITGNLIIFGSIDNYVSLNSGSLIVQGDIILDGGNDFDGTNGYALQLWSTVTCGGNIIIQNHYSSSNCVDIQAGVTAADQISFTANGSGTSGAAVWLQAGSLSVQNDAGQINFILNSCGGIYNAVVISGSVTAIDQVNCIGNNSAASTAVWMQNGSVATVKNKFNCIANSSDGNYSAVYIGGLITSNNQIDFIANSNAVNSNAVLVGGGGGLTATDEINFIANYGYVHGVLVSSGLSIAAPVINFIVNTSTVNGGVGVGLIGAALSGSDEINFVANNATGTGGIGVSIVAGTISRFADINFVMNSGSANGVAFSNTTLSALHDINCVGNGSIFTDSNIAASYEINFVANHNSLGTSNIYINSGSFTAENVNFIDNSCNVAAAWILFINTTVTFAVNKLNFIANLGYGNINLITILIDGNLNMNQAGSTISFITNRAEITGGSGFGVMIQAANFIANSIDSYGGTTGIALSYNGTNYPNIAGGTYTGPIPPA